MKKGFTLLELIIVIIILGILASFAIPQFIRAAEKGRAGEALSLLPVLGQAQIRLAVEQGAFSAAPLADLDVDAPTPRFFTVAGAAAGATSGIILGNALSNSVVIAMTRNALQRPGTIGAYVLSICETGALLCTDPAGGINECDMVGVAAAAACPAP